jgi:hypothetical protein
MPQPRGHWQLRQRLQSSPAAAAPAQLLACALCCWHRQSLRQVECKQQKVGRLDEPRLLSATLFKRLNSGHCHAHTSPAPCSQYNRPLHSPLSPPSPQPQCHQESASLATRVSVGPCTVQRPDGMPSRACRSARVHLDAPLVRQHPARLRGTLQCRAARCDFAAMGWESAAGSGKPPVSGTAWGHAE